MFIPYENRKVDVKEFLHYILSFHQQNTPYWENELTPKKIDEIISGTFEEVVYNLSKLKVDQGLLRTRWMNFKPRNLKNARLVFSSGTTGPQKFCMLSEAYVEKQVEYLHYYLSKQVNIAHAIIHGPAHVYKDVTEALVHRFNGVPYFLPISIENINKKEIEYALKAGKEETIKLLKKYFSKLIENTNKLLDVDEEINFMRSYTPALMYFEDLFGVRELDAVMISGLAYSPMLHMMLSSKFKHVIPTYGYFAFGDALAKYSSNNLDYYPAFPYTIFSVIKDGEIVKYDEEGNPLFIIAREDLFLVLREDNEYARRVGPNDEFKWDGIRNPYRKI